MNASLYISDILSTRLETSTTSVATITSRPEAQTRYIVVCFQSGSVIWSLAFIQGLLTRFQLYSQDFTALKAVSASAIRTITKLLTVHKL